MKNIFIILLIGVVTLMVSCFNNDDNKKEETYFLSCTLTEQPKGVPTTFSGTLSAGPTNTGFESVPACSLYDALKSSKSMYPYRFYLIAGKTADVYAHYFGTTDGVVLGLYTNSITAGTTYTTGNSSCNLAVTVEGVEYDLSGSDFSITITSYGDVGGSVAGEYSGTVTADTITYYTLSGTFNLKREADQLITTSPFIF